ncbi:hypothetical protein Aple_036920 [Acrocarpospora pleiomorpha]|uniref:Carboxylesterase type B domain-containing protein n=1 Tax=Acrocarpospora pleiomorpha TaxID=90975 RepID=A0A5M3XJD6_9ACTN|nr:hypothetical protein Aple_036920 [Acrocarpospora pleiomorpha]
MPDSIVETRSGRVRGAFAEGVHVFKGIPYGGPTHGSQRFRPPTPPERWTGVRDTYDYGPSCPQVSLEGFYVKNAIGGGDLGERGLPQSEDCLRLNVWTGGLADGAYPPGHARGSRPVPSGNHPEHAGVVTGQRRALHRARQGIRL